MKKLTFLLLLMMQALIGYAQRQNITFRHLTTDDGLSQFSVNSIYADEWGTIWIGTREGLNYYNGNRIETFKLEKNNPSSLFCNNVLRITGDKNGKIYLICTEGVAQFNQATKEFKTLLTGTALGIFYKDRLYISIKNEVFSYNEATGNFDFFYRLPMHAQGSITAIHIDGDNNVWMGTDHDGVYRLSKDKKLEHPIDKGNIVSIYNDSQGELWIGSWEQGLYRIAANGEVVNMQHEPNNPNSISSNFVRTFCEDAQGDIWIGTFNGLNRFHKQSGEFEVYSQNSNSGSLTHSSVWCMVKDPQGTIWMGTYFGGVNYFNPEYEIYTRHSVADSEEKGLSSPIIGRMIEDNSGRLWICTEGGGISIYDRATNSYKWIRKENRVNGLSGNNVKSIYYDCDNELMWVGTHIGGLNRIDLRTKQFTHYLHKEGDDTTLPSDIIRDIVPYKGNYIIGTQNGVTLFNPVTGRCKPLLSNNKLGKSIKMVADVFVDSNHTVWIAATGEGVFSYDPESDELINYRHDEKNRNSLSNNNVNNIMEDKNGFLWFSTSGSGIDMFNKKTGIFENFDMENSGLASDCVYEICESSYRPDHLLLITNQSLSVFDVASRSVKNYSADNGFPITAFNENALYISRSGEIYLGGIQGMISLNEQQLELPRKSYGMTFTRLTVNDRNVEPGDDTGILQKSLSYTSQITLSAEQNIFSIEFATSNHIPANRNQMLYRLKGFSDQWSVSRGEPVITYTNLNAGNYTLEVKPDVKDAEALKLRITVLPPWYRTWWAYLLYSLSILLLLIYIIRAYRAKIRLQESLRYEQKHTEDIEALNQSKLRFFTNISHEFRTPLTLIVGQIETLLQLQSFPPQVYNKILDIYKSSLQLRELISELLDFRKQEQGHMKIKASRHNIVSFLYENYLLFAGYAANKKIELKFEKCADDIEVWYDQNQLQKVINNLLSNALKYTKEGDTILMEVKQEADEVVIRVSDTGTGINAKEVDKIFDRFYQTNQFNSLATGAGTGIGLALTKGIVELHHGRISVTSQVDHGTCFTIVLKTGNKHFEEEQLSYAEEQTLKIDATYNNATLLEKNLLEEEELPGQPSDAKMLIVEDDDAIRSMLGELFAPFYQINTASNGAEALEKIKEDMPNIILSDVVMPQMSGTELCKAVKTNFDTCHIPVVLLTARTAIEHTVEGLKLGADDYINKPFNTRILVSRCNNLINSRIQLQEKFSKQPQAYAQILATNPMDKEMIDRAIEIIERYLDDPEFNVNIFAREMGMARTNLFTKLKAISGQTPNDFILTIRLKRGAVMLRNSLDLNISEISDRIGFSSPRYFSKCFKDLYKVSPMSYRKGETESSEVEEVEDEKE